MSVIAHGHMHEARINSQYNETMHITRSISKDIDM